MNLLAAPQRAETITAPKAAARMYADAEFELAMGEPTTEQEQAGEQALQILEQRFPGIKQRANDVVEHGHLPNMSRKAKDNTYGTEPTRRDPHGAPLDARPKQPRQRGASAPKAAGGRARRATRIDARPAYGTRAARVSRMQRRAWQQSGLPQTGASASQLIMRTLGTIAGLSLVYVLVGPRGSAAVSTLTNGVDHAMSALVNPNVDPLRPSGGIAKGSPLPVVSVPGTGRQTTNPNTPQRSINSTASRMSKALVPTGGRWP